MSGEAITVGQAEVCSWASCLARFEPEWHALWQRTGAAPDLSPMWAKALVHGHQIDPATLHVVVLRQADELVLVWPFQVKAQRRLGMPVMQIGPLQNVFCLHGGLLTSVPVQEAVCCVVQALREGRVRWDRLMLGYQEIGTPLHDAWLKAANESSSGMTRSEGDRSPYLQHTGSFDELLATKSRNFREKMRARQRDLKKDPALRLTYYTLPQDMSRYLSAVAVIEPRTWKHAEGSAITSRDWEMRFYEHLLAGLAPMGRVVAGVMYASDEPIAHSLDLVHGDRVFGLKWSYDQTHAKRRPGVVMMVDRLGRYFADGMHEYDFTAKDEAYKLQWTSSTRNHEDLTLYAPGWRGRYVLALDALLAGARQRLQRRPTPTEAQEPATVMPDAG